MSRSYKKYPILQSKKPKTYDKRQQIVRKPDKNRDAKIPQHGNPITYCKANSVVYLRGGKCESDEERAPPLPFSISSGACCFDAKEMQ